MERLENTPQWPGIWLRHQRRDEYWLHGSPCADYAAIQCPTLLIGGWVDGYVDGILAMAQHLPAPPGPSSGRGAIPTRDRAPRADAGSSISSPGGLAIISEVTRTGSWTCPGDRLHSHRHAIRRTDQPALRRPADTGILASRAGLATFRPSSSI